MSATISCLAVTSEQAERIVRELHAEGINQERISVLLPDPRLDLKLNIETTGPMDHGPVVGAGTGIAMGSILGWITGLAMFSIPGVGPFLAAGPILAIMGSATVGAIAGGLVGMGMPAIQAAHYEKKLREGRFMIWVDVHDASEIARVTATFSRHQAEDITRSVAAIAMVEETNIPAGK